MSLRKHCSGKAGSLGRLLKRFSALEDLRQRQKVPYLLDEIVLLVLCAVLSGADEPQLIVLDGKTSRCIGERRSGLLPLHLGSLPGPPGSIWCSIRKR